MIQLVFATQNQNKAKEIQAILPDGYKVLTLSDINCHDDIPETASTLEGNSELKADYIFKKYNINCFADDTGLEIEALNNEPGVYSARYAGNQKNSEDNMNLVLEKLGNNTNRQARFRTSICLILNGSKHFFEGVVDGKITTEKQGQKGFGYDPIFLPNGADETFAEMDLAQKNKMSHRARAIQEMIQFLSNQ